LDLKVATLAERIETRQAQCEGALERLRSDMARRDMENTRWQIGLWVAAVVVLGILIRWPVPPAP